MNQMMFMSNIQGIFVYSGCLQRNYVMKTSSSWILIAVQAQTMGFDCFADVRTVTPEVDCCCNTNHVPALRAEAGGSLGAVAAASTCLAVLEMDMAVGTVAGKL